MSGQEHRTDDLGATSEVVESHLGVEAAAAHEAFVTLAYRAAFDRIPSPVEIEGQVSTLSGGVTYSEFLAALLASPERQGLNEARSAERERLASAELQAAELVTIAYRAVLEREADEGGLEINVAFLKGGGTPAAFLERLCQSEEARLRRGDRDGHARRQLYRAMEPERFVRLGFEAVLDREADDGAVAFYVAELEERMTPGDFLASLANSPEGQNLKRQQGMAPALAACASITELLEGMLRKRGVVLDFGPVPAFEASAHVVETTLTSLVATIEMLLARDVDELFRPTQGQSELTS